MNPETKLLLLGHAFAHGYRRVRLQADDANHRSRAAIERLGAEPAGVLPRDRVRADGTVAGTAVYWVTAERWPTVAARLRERLAGLPGPVRLRPWPRVTDVDGREVGRDPERPAVAPARSRQPDRLTAWHRSSSSPPRWSTTSPSRGG